MNTLKNILQLLESKQTLLKAVKALTIDQIIDLGEYSTKGDNIDPLVRSKNKAIDEITTADNNSVAANLTFSYRNADFTACIYFTEENGKPKAIDVVIEKDKNRFRR